MKKSFYILLIIILSSKVFGQDSNPEIDSLKSMLETQEGLDRAKTLRSLSINYYNKSTFNKSLQYAIDALDIYQIQDLDSNAAHIHLIMGAIYREINQRERAEQQYKIALEGFEKYNNSWGIGVIYQNLGVLYDLPGQEEKAIHYTKLSIEKAKERKDTFALVRVYNNISFKYFLLKKHNISMQYIDTALTLLSFVNSPEEYKERELLLKVNLSENYVFLKQYKKALPLLLEVIEQQKILKFKAIRDSYRMLATIYSDQGDYKKAFLSQSEEKKYIELLNNQVSDELLMEVTVQNELKYKEQEKQLLQKEKEIAVLKLQDQESKNNFMKIGLFLILIILIITIFNFFKTRKKNKQLVEVNLEMLSKHEKVLYELTLKNIEKKLQPKENKTSDLSTEQKQEIIDALNIAFNKKEVFKNEELTTNSLAKELNTNRNYLRQVIKEITPTGFLDFVNEYRIRKSWTLLSNPEFFHLTIEHISKEVGFKSQPTFNKAFKKFTGVTPSFYLNEVKNKEKTI